MSIAEERRRAEAQRQRIAEEQARTAFKHEEHERARAEAEFEADQAAQATERNAAAAELQRAELARTDAAQQQIDDETRLERVDRFIAGAVKPGGFINALIQFTATGHELHLSTDTNTAGIQLRKPDEVDHALYRLAELDHNTER